MFDTTGESRHLGFSCWRAPFHVARSGRCATSSDWSNDEGKIKQNQVIFQSLLLASNSGFFGNRDLAMTVRQSLNDFVKSKTFQEILEYVLAAFSGRRSDSSVMYNADK